MIAGRCKRDHDTSYPEARDNWRRCKRCKQLIRNRKYDILYETSYARQISRYSQYIKTLQKRIKFQEERVDLLERILANAEEI
jgi:hypothetical protein